MWRQGRRAAVWLAACLLLAGCQQHTSRTPVLHVDRPTALVDQPLRITVSGLAGGQDVTVRAETTDHSKLAWSSWANFQAARDGTVDLTTAAPRAGTYAGADPMGLLWSLQPPRAKDAWRTDLDWYTKDPLPITLTAQAEDGKAASVRLLRLQLAEGVVRRPLREHGLVGALYTTTPRRPRPTVLVLGGSEGGVPDGTAELLASHGYAALALGYFGAPGLPRQLDRIPLEYFARALAWLRAQPEAGGGRVLVKGISRGGELALLLGATYPDAIAGVVAVVPSSTINPGITAGGRMTAEAAWTRHGRPLGPGSIPVRRIDGPVMLVSGTDDRLWRSYDSAVAIAGELRAAHHRFPVRNLVYQGAGHLILAPFWPTSLTASPDLRLYFGGSAAANARANADSWPKILAFIAEYGAPDHRR
jgi:dienelactone hydrolase